MKNNTKIIGLLFITFLLVCGGIFFGCQKTVNMEKPAISGTLKSSGGVVTFVLRQDLDSLNLVCADEILSFIKKHDATVTKASITSVTLNSVKSDTTEAYWNIAITTDSQTKEVWNMVMQSFIVGDTVVVASISCTIIQPATGPYLAFCMSGSCSSCPDPSGQGPGFYCGNGCGGCELTYIMCAP